MTPRHDDDWDTDPDFVRDMNETQQRWGSQRTCGNLNMSKFIDEVKTQKQVREEHSSQRDHSLGFGGRFGIQQDRRDKSALDYDYHEKLSKHSSQEIRKTSGGHPMGEAGPSYSVDDARRAFFERTETREVPRPCMKPYVREHPISVERDERHEERHRTSEKIISDDRSRPQSFTRVHTVPTTYESSSSRKKIEEKHCSSTSSFEDLPSTMRSIQDEIDAFKREFEELQDKVSRRVESKLIETKSSSSTEKEHTSYSKHHVSPSTSRSPTSPTLHQPSRSNIKSLSKKLESMFVRDEEDYTRQSEMQRREKFEEIRKQVHETRKGLDGFDPIDEPLNIRARTRPSSRWDRAEKATWCKAFPEHLPRSAVIQDHREREEEEIMSKQVKINDKIVEDQTKRRFERTSSNHSLSDLDHGVESSSSSRARHSLVKQRQTTSGPPTAAAPKVVRIETPSETMRKARSLFDGNLMARTLYDYKAHENDELSFNADDLITDIERVDGGWYRGTITRDGRRVTGMFPANYVKIINDSDED